MRLIFLIAACCCTLAGAAQRQQWVDSIFATLSDDERITQLMVIRTSSMDAKGNPVMYDSLANDLVSKYNVGAVCLFQGSPAQQAALLNSIQGRAKTPIMVTVDGEWGLGMRFAGVKSFPFQLTMGALPDAELVYRVGAAIAAQCRRMGIHVNYAPVVDINNNPANPVIGVRSFGEDKYKVALMGTRIMLGMQDNGIMACAKHFPGHGDVSVDSHYDLPIINKSMSQLQGLELYPFKVIFAKGIGSAMVAHLSIPAIDSTPNKPTSISYNNITNLMRNELGYQGLTFTDALEMKGVAKYFPSGEAAVQSLIAGNDMLCLPADVPLTLAAIKKAIGEGRLSWTQIYTKCKRVLEAKYDYVQGRTSAIDTANLLSDLNAEVDPLRREVARGALTVLRGAANSQPLRADGKQAYVLVGATAINEMAQQLRKQKVPVFFFDIRNGRATDSLLRRLQAGKYSRLVVGVHDVRRSPAGNFGISDSAVALIQKLGEAGSRRTLLLFGNPYALANFETSRYSQIVACYEDDAVFQQVALQWLKGAFAASGKLPVSIGSWKYGSGAQVPNSLPTASPEAVGMSAARLAAIDSIATEGISKGAYPGCVVTVLRRGKLVWQKAYGYLDATQTLPASAEHVYDLASVTKTSATTVAVMKLVEEGRLDLKKKTSDYLPWLKGGDKENLTIENLLLHQAGLVAWIPFYKEVTDTQSGQALPTVFRRQRQPGFEVPVTEQLHMRNDWVDTMYRRIYHSPVVTNELKYVYSDNDFILLGKVVEAVSGLPLDRYVAQTFYQPLGMHSTGFKPFEHFANSSIAPTEHEKIFRQQLIWGYVHDPGAAMLGNVAGHAGLFSNASDLARLYLMLLNGGEYNGRRYLKKETIDWFTSYQTPISRRGLGFDKPEKNNAIRSEKSAYPARWVSGATYGHTGFTGTCVWADPTNELLYIFLSNRVHPQGGDNRALLDLNIRGRIHDVIYESIRMPADATTATAAKKHP